MGYKVAVVGATGNVGREMLNILDERKFPADEVVALASRRSMGVEVSYGDRTLKVKALENYDFSDVDICLMSAGDSGSILSMKARMPPHWAWPSTTICFTRSAPTANSSAADTP